DLAGGAMGEPGRPRLRFEVLGPLRVARGDLALPLGPLQQRVVLAVLLLHANRPVGREQLIDAVWGEAAPASAVNLLQRHVAGARRILGPDAHRLVWTDAGYLLTVADGELDLAGFDGEVRRARAARAQGRRADAAAGLRRALELWRGTPVDGLAS